MDGMWLVSLTGDGIVHRGNRERTILWRVWGGAARRPKRGRKHWPDAALGFDVRAFSAPLAPSTGARIGTHRTFTSSTVLGLGATADREHVRAAWVPTRFPTRIMNR